MGAGRRLHKVALFYDGQLIKTHPRASVAGMWVTDEGDYPPKKSKYLLKTTAHYQQQALQYGEYVGQLVGRIMTEHAYRNLRKVQGLFRLADKYGSEALNLTAKGCLFYEDERMSTIKRILERQLYRLPLQQETVQKASVTSSFIRDARYFNHTKEVKP